MSADAVFPQAQALLQGGRAAEAGRLLRDLLLAQPGHLEARNLLGVCLCQAGDPAGAVGLFEGVLAAAPRHVGALINLATALQGLQRYGEAVRHYEQALALGAGNAMVYGNLANAHRGLGHFKAALGCYDQALALRPDHLAALFNKGVLLFEHGQYAEALDCFARADALQPGNVDIRSNRANALFKLGRADEAVAGLAEVAALAPGRADCQLRLAALLQMLGRDAEAVAPLRQAVRLAPGASQPLLDLAMVHFRLGRFDESLALLDELLARQPADAAAHVNRGAVLERLGRYDDALESYGRAVALAPDSAQAQANRAGVLWRLRRHEEALAAYEAAGGAASPIAYVPGEWLHARMWLARWDGFDDAVAAVLAAVARGEPAARPFTLLATPAPAALQLQCARDYAARNHPAGPALWQGQARRHDRLRLGYFSADFYNHATAYLMAGLFERHDRRRFELVAFNLGARKTDAMAERLRGAFDRVIEAGDLSDRQIAERALAEEIDIAVDLKGYTGHARPGVFALRPAPIQVNYLGYPGSLGADYFDYLVADATVVPPEQRDHYTEKIAWLPFSYQANDGGRPIAAAPSRGEAGLPEDAFVFCCFNNNYKITPDLFDAWMRLLAAVEDSVLWLFEGNGAAARQLAAAAHRRGIDPQRLVFAPFRPVAEHLARHALADLFLDTWYCNAHTTASDALWAGLPLVTLAGQTFAGRVAASLLRAVGLPELVATTPAAYEALALDLARDRPRLAALRQRLAGNRLTQPLFDTGRFAGHLEAAYLAMADRQRQGLAPDHIVVAP